MPVGVSFNSRAFTNLTRNVRRGLRGRGGRDILFAGALVASREIRRRAPRRTGTLQRSIFATRRLEQSGDVGVRVGTTYAAFQELGTKYIRPHNFVTGALRSRSTLRAIQRAMERRFNALIRRS